MKKQYTLSNLKRTLLFVLVFMTSQAQAQLYPFTSHVFIPSGATGRTGPSLADCQAAYSTEPWASNLSYFNMTTQGIQQWVVPTTGLYSIASFGAAGGTGYNQNGDGAYIYGEFNLTQGDTLYILVGQQGGNSATQGGGGGGASFVWETNSNLLIAAGGGGGGSDQFSVAVVSDYINGQVTEALLYNATIGSGGPLGTSSSWMGGGGAGWNSDGASDASYGQGGLSPANGGLGGDFQSVSYPETGGFGGGGGPGYDAGGGGGGYTGGNGGTYNTNLEHAGGGGSFNSGTNQNSASGTNTGDGSVEITRLCTPISTTVSNQTVCAGDLVTLSATGNGTITWNNGVLDSVAFANPIGTTTYTVSSTDLNECSVSIDITTNALPVVDAFVTDSVICLGDSVLMYGTGADTYTWDNAVMDSIYFTPTIGGSTNYTISATDSNGCIGMNGVDLFVSELAITAQLINENSGSDGEIDLTLTGGSSSYNILWSTAETSEDISGLTAGSYNVTINDGGCSLDSTFTIMNVAGLFDNDNIELNVYPNPSKGVFTIEVEGVFNFQVVNIDGKLILDENANNSVVVDLTNFSNGVYFVKLNSNGIEKTIKLIKK